MKQNFKCGVAFLGNSVSVKQKQNGVSVFQSVIELNL
jgi:hypothetical protein